MSEPIVEPPVRSLVGDAVFGVGSASILSLVLAALAPALGVSMGANLFMLAAAWLLGILLSFFVRPRWKILGVHRVIFTITSGIVYVLLAIFLATHFDRPPTSHEIADAVAGKLTPILKRSQAPTTIPEIQRASPPTVVAQVPVNHRESPEPHDLEVLHIDDTPAILLPSGSYKYQITIENRSGESIPWYTLNFWQAVSPRLLSEKECDDYMNQVAAKARQDASMTPKPTETSSQLEPGSPKTLTEPNVTIDKDTNDKIKIGSVILYNFVFGQYTGGKSATRFYFSAHCSYTDSKTGLFLLCGNNNFDKKPGSLLPRSWPRSN